MLVDDKPDFLAPELPEWLQWLMAGLVGLAALVVIFGRWYISRTTEKSPVLLSPAPSSWISYPARPERYGLIDTSPEARAVQGDRYWQPGSYGFHR
jgi:hypothetical protein